MRLVGRSGISLELGGKNTMYVAADANLERAAEGAVRACFNGAGQLCVAMERLVVHEQVADRFLALFLSRVHSMRLNTALDWSADMGSLFVDRPAGHRHSPRRGRKGPRRNSSRRGSSPAGHRTVVLRADGARRRDARDGLPRRGDLRAGGRALSSPLRRGGDRPRQRHGVRAECQRLDPQRRARPADPARIKAGTVNINEGYAAAWGSVGAPMGGMKDSGLSRRHGAEGITKYTEVQNITAQHVLGLGAPFGLSQEAWARAMTISLKALKRTGLR